MSGSTSASSAPPAKSYTRRKERAKQIFSLADKDIHHDYKELLNRPDVDAVFIATPDQLAFPHGYGRGESDHCPGVAPEDHGE